MTSFVKFRQNKIPLPLVWKRNFQNIQFLLCSKLQRIDLNGAAPGMGGLGIDRSCHIAPAQILHNPVGIADGGSQFLGHFRHGNLVGTAALNDALQLLDGHGGQAAALGNAADIRQGARCDYHAAFAVQRTDQIAVGIHHEGLACEFRFLGSNLHIVHSVGNIGANAVSR